MKQPEAAYWVAAMLGTKKGVSDLNVTVGKGLQVEINGELTSVEVDPPVEKLTPFQTEVFALNLINGNQRLLNDLVRTGSCDLSYVLGKGARFRVNIFTQKSCYSTVMRKLETTIPSIEDFGFPPCFYDMAEERNGLILFTGGTGTGKTTSLASILNQINKTRSVHLVTLEDPIEYVHPHKKATFNQREQGDDFDSFASGLRSALRQAPKVILVGEIRDRETLEIALTAAETGHVVFSSLHTIDAGQTLNRIIGMFEHDEQEQIRVRLSDTIRWVVSQRLLPKVGGGRVASQEILRSSLRVTDILLNGEDVEADKTFYNVIEEGSTLSMKTFDQDMLDLFTRGLIDEKAALTYCTNRSVIKRGMDNIKAARGESTTDISGLSMQEEEEDA
ncbi:MAG: PilT/PilU family type 4a pilus ATPase [Candidatus Electrothrix communis]|nr:PilT/PilU family type 4a pilus ATPase [Desulfobulbus sp. US4]WLE96515.1 MAG: PilT/PilU family type 4a pilus ATPase [Candidatus Electrothrix communis]